MLFLSKNTQIAKGASITPAKHKYNKNMVKKHGERSNLSDADV